MRKPLLSLSVLCRVTAVLLWVPSLSPAVEFGELEVHSEWDEELDLEVGLMSLAPAELGTLSIGLASRSEFSRAGIAYPKYAESLEFRILEGAGGTHFVTVTTSVPVREKLVQFLLSATWSRGKVVREYTVWLAPPLFSGEPDAPVEIPSTGDGSGPGTDSGLPEEAAGIVLPPTVHVQRGDTLSGIVHSLDLPASLTRFQGYTAVLEANPDAFIKGNMNRLLAGAVLNIPSPEVISRINPEAALQQFLAQSGQYHQYLTDIGYFGQEEAGSGEADAQPGTGLDEQARLSIGQEVSDEALSTALEGGHGDSGQIEALEKQSAQAEETLLSAEAQSEEIREELTAMQAREDRVSTLIEIESSNLATIQDPVEPAGNEPENGLVAMETAEQPAGDTQGAGERPAEESEEADAAGTPADSEPAGEAVGDEDMEPAAGPEAVTRDDASPGDAETANAVADPVEEEPVEEETVIVSGQAPASSIMESLSALFGEFGDYVLKIIAGLLVLMAVLFFYRRRNSRQPSHGGLESGRSGVPSWAGGTGVADTDGADPLQEAEVYLAYHRDEQAIQVLEEAYAASPQRHDLAEKLLEIFHQHNDRTAFDALAGALRTRLGENPGPVWSRVAAMGREINPENAGYAETDGAPDIPEPPDHPEAEGTGTSAADDPRPAEADEPATGKMDRHQKAGIALQLAETYAQLGEKDIASDYIHEVLSEGSKKQKAKAEKLAEKWEI